MNFKKNITGLVYFFLEQVQGGQFISQNQFLNLDAHILRLDWIVVHSFVTCSLCNTKLQTRDHQCTVIKFQGLSLVNKVFINENTLNIEYHLENKNFKAW